MKKLYILLIFNTFLCFSQSKTISDFDKLIESNPKDVSNYYSRGLLKASKYDFAGAIKDFNVVIIDNKRNLEALYNRALSKAELNDFTGAIADLTTILKFDSKKSDIYFKRSFLYASQGNKTNACLDARKAYSLGSVDAKSLINMLCN